MAADHEQRKPSSSYHRKLKATGWSASAILVISGVWLSLFLYKTAPARYFTPYHIQVFTSPEASVIDRAASAGGDRHKESMNNSITIDAAKEEAFNEASFNLLLLGTDAWDDELARTDVIMVVHVTPAQPSVRLLSIPRDTLVNVKGVGNTKITHAHVVGQQIGGNRTGTEYAAETVSHLLNVPIHYVVKVNFGGLQRLIDQIGGVELYVEDRLQLPSIELQSGWNHLNGEHALQFVRERYSLASGDFGRQKHQADLLRSVASSLLQPDNLLSIVTSLPEYLQDIQDTNLSNQDFLSLMRMMSGLKSEDIDYYQLEGRGEMLYDSMLNQKLWFWSLNEEALESTIKLWQGGDGGEEHS